MNNLPVKCTKKSVKTPKAGSVQPSVQGVVAAFSTKGAKPSSEDYKEIIACLTTMLMGLAQECLNNDAWYLAMHQALAYAKKLGIEENKFKEISLHVFEIQQKMRQTNPMASMF